jgi:hypothetical protein
MFFLFISSLFILGVPLDALRSYQTTTAAAAPYVFATHAGQTIQQPALYAAQLQAVAQQQQAAQWAAVAAQQQQQQQQQHQQQQQQSLINGVPAGYMVVRTANGSYALLAQPQTASAAAAMQSQAQAPFAQQQYISFNAAGQPTATSARYSVAMVGGQPQQIVYQYAGQPTMQAAPTQYIQVPSNYLSQQQQQLSTSPVMHTGTSAAQQGLNKF